METTFSPLVEVLVDCRAVLAAGSFDGTVRASTGQDVAWLLWPHVTGSAKVSVERTLRASLHRQWFPIAELEALCAEVEACNTKNPSGLS